MPLTVSNTVTAPTNAALQNKMNPQPLVPANGVYYGGQQVPAQGTAAYNQAAQNYQNSQRQSTPTPSPTPSNIYPQGLYQSVVGNLSGLGTGGGQANYTSNAAQQGLMSQVYNPVTGQLQPNPTQTSVSGLQNIAQNQTPEVIAQQKAYNDFAQSSPYMVAAQYNPNVAADVASGRASLLGKTFADILAAKSQAVQNALAGQSQQITAGTNAGNLTVSGLAQQSSAAQNAGNLALTGQGQQISALNAAAGFAQPQLGNYGQTYYNPLTGETVGSPNNGGALNPLNNVQSIAQQVISGQISPSQAYAMGGNVGNWQGVLNQAIQQASPGFNTATAQGQYEARQANTTTSGTAPVNAAAAAYGQAYPQLLDLQNTVQNVDQFGNLLLNTMVDANGNRINPTDAKFANNTLANIRSQLSSPQQAVFDNTFASLKSRISGLLAAGGSEIPTQITADANKILDGSLPLGSLSAVLQRISTEGNILLSNLKSKLNTAGGVIGAPTAGNGGASNPAGL